MNAFGIATTTVVCALAAVIVAGDDAPGVGAFAAILCAIAGAVGLAVVQ